MKFLRYGPRGAEKPGILDEQGNVRDLSGLVGDIAGDVLMDLNRFNDLDIDSLPLVEGAPRIGACVGGIGKFMCIGLNYSDHAKESGMPVPPEPILFMKASSAICGPNDPILIPRGSEKTDWEVELGVVIGKRAKYVEEADALDHVAGYWPWGVVLQDHQLQVGCPAPAARAAPGVAADHAVVLATGGEVQLHPAFVGAIGDYLVLNLAPGFAPQSPGDAVQQGRFAVAVGAAQAGYMQSGEIQRRYVFSVTQEVSESEFEGYHGEGLEPAPNRGFNRKLGLKPATCNLHRT